MMDDTHIHDPRPLARNEIESVLQLSRETVYVPTERRQALKDKNFVKRPIAELAQLADAPVMVEQAAEPTLGEAGQGLPQGADETPQSEPVAPDMHQPAPEDIAAAADTQPGGLPVGSDALQAEPQTELQAELQAEPQAEIEPAAGGSSPAFEPTPVAQAAIPTDAEVQDRIDEAYARGLSEGDTQARQRLEDGCLRLENLVTSLIGHEAIDVEELGRHIEETVMRLASLRAGYAIKEMPQPFAQTIEHLVQRVSKEAGSGTLYLNTADLAVVQPLLESRDSFIHIGFKADDTLKPGDIRLSVGSVEAEDRLTRRADVDMDENNAAAELDEVERHMRNLLDEAPATDAGPDTDEDTQ